jgi:hypothetical protein
MQGRLEKHLQGFRHHFAHQSILREAMLLLEAFAAWDLDPKK